MIDTINIALSDSTKYDDQDLFQKVSDINTLKQKKPSNFTLCDLIQLTLKGHLDMINKDKVKKQYSEFCIQEKDFEGGLLSASSFENKSVFPLHSAIAHSSSSFGLGSSQRWTRRVNLQNS